MYNGLATKYGSSAGGTAANICKGVEADVVSKGYRQLGAGRTAVRTEQFEASRSTPEHTQLDAGSRGGVWYAW